MKQTNEFLFIVVGCGGIGGNVIRDLPKLTTGRRAKIILVDGDKVDKSNCVRQPYQEQDIGLNKARVLARKINSFYKIECEYFDKYITDQELEVLIKNNKDVLPIIIGCVDNDATRAIIEKNYLKQENAVLIDGANSKYEGNVYCSAIVDGIRKGPIRSDVYKLESDINPGTVGCEAQVAKGEIQYLITNNKVASVILEYLHDILTQSNKFPVGVTVIERFKTLYY